MSETHLRALDLFAGSGWGVACQWLGIDEFGVENMPEAINTRRINGMKTIYEDVWDGLEKKRLDYDILIASPPCQTFSLAGSGSGRKALDDVIGLIIDETYQSPDVLKSFATQHDPRTALVLTPLSHVFRDRPEYVVFEQVPSVLPVWEACSIAMHFMGYSTDVGVLSSEQYGVGQVRKRAILVASKNKEAKLPTPTHSRYRANGNLDSGLRKWNAVQDVVQVPRGARYLRSNYGSGGDPDARGERLVSHPGSTITSKSGSQKWMPQSIGLTVAEAASIQSYPEGFVFAGSKIKQMMQVGNAVPPLMAKAILDGLVG